MEFSIGSTLRKKTQSLFLRISKTPLCHRKLLRFGSRRLRYSSQLFTNLDIYRLYLNNISFGLFLSLLAGNPESSSYWEYLPLFMTLILPQFHSAFMGTRTCCPNPKLAVLNFFQKNRRTLLFSFELICPKKVFSSSKSCSGTPMIPFMKTRFCINRYNSSKIRFCTCKKLLRSKHLQKLPQKSCERNYIRVLR